MYNRIFIISFYLLTSVLKEEISDLVKWSLKPLYPEIYNNEQKFDSPRIRRNIFIVKTWRMFLKFLNLARLAGYSSLQETGMRSDFWINLSVIR